MKRRSEAVKEWLARSWTSPLSVSIFAAVVYSEHYAEIIHNAGEMVLDAIAPSCKRWREIELTMPLDLYQKFETKFDVVKPQNLTQIRLRLDTRPDNSFIFGGTTYPHSIALLSAPNLQEASLPFPTTQPFDFFYLDNCNKMAPIWAQLTRLFLHMMIPDKDIHLFLRACPRVIECGLWAYSRGSFGLTPDAESDLQVEAIYLPQLRIFKITDGGSPAIMRNTFASLSAPELSRIDYWREDPFHDSFGRQPAPLVLLETAQSVRTLHLDPQGMPRDTIVACLRTIPNLKHLVIGRRPSPYRPEGEPRGVWLPPYPATPFPLEDLVIENSQVDGMSDVLLPSLESFELHEPFDNVSDSTLRKFICSRVGPAAARRGFSALKRVEGNFGRPMQQDISKEVRQGAAEAGVKVNLDLTCSSENEDSETKNPFSVEYGLTRITRRTWRYSILES